MLPRSTHLRLEALEARHAPATLIGANTLTYQDADGDNVTLTVSKSILTVANANTIFTFVGGSGVDGSNTAKQQLTKIDLTSIGAAATGLSIATKATRSAVNGGDGFATVGQIDASGIDLGAVVIDGDLGRMLAGDGTLTTAGVKSLRVQSMGRFGVDTGAANLNSVIQGKLGALTVKADVKDVLIDVKGGNDGDIGRVGIGGSLIGGFTFEAGCIRAESDIGNVTIGGSVIGSGGFGSGQITTVGGTIGRLAIGGDLQGGGGNSSGLILSNGAMRAVRIIGNVIGGSAGGDNDLQQSGCIKAQRIGTLTIRGSLIAGNDFTIGNFSDSGAVRVADDIGSAVIGNLVGNTTNPVIISARGKAVQTKTDLAIGRLTVRGRVEFAQILAGYNLSGAGVNADAQIGSLTVGGDWIASSAVAGAIANNNQFGDGDDTVIAGGNPAIVSKIGRLTIRGQAIGTVGGTDQFGIVAENVGVVKVGGTKIPTNGLTGNEEMPIGVSGDFKVNEI